jgi:MFS family permease
LGELAGFAFLWAFVEMLGPTMERIRRAKWASLFGFFFVVASWIAGGFYYVTVYGVEVKPVIKAGPLPWAHLIFMETKEHVFLFLPFLALIVVALLWTYGPRLTTNLHARRAVLVVSGLTVLMVLAVAFMGFIVTSGYRQALSTLHLLVLPMAAVGIAAAVTAVRTEEVEEAVAERLPLWGIYLAAILSMVVVTILTIGAELNADLKGWLKGTFSHHWIGKGVLAILTFLVVVGVTYWTPRSPPTQPYRWALATFAVALLLGAVLLGFFVVEFLLK